MKKQWIVAGCLACLFTAVYFAEKNSIVSKMKTMQNQAVPSGMLNYGKISKILKQAGLIKAVPDNAADFLGTYAETSKSLIRILFEIDIDTDLQIYWATGKKKYSAEHAVSIPVTAGQKEYAVAIPSLNEITKLRIDPSMQPCRFAIKRIILESYGEENIILSPSVGLEQLKQINGIIDTNLKQDGVYFKAINNDAQLELVINDIKPYDFIHKISFKRKRQETSFQYVANIHGIKSFPSSNVITKEDLKKKWPIVSVVIDDDDLYHPDTGTISNQAYRGKDWERPAYFSYFDENGALRFASMTGIRIHGGLRLQLYNSFRVYFRKEYGLSQFSEFKPKIAFSSNEPSLKRLVVHHTAWPEGGWFFNNTFAYDIARQIGCQIPETKLILLYINGIEQGIFFLAPHIDNFLLESYFGHKNFVFYKYKSDPSSEATILHLQILWSLVHSRDRLTMKEAGKRVDIDNMTRHLLSFIFCGTSDYAQGVAVFDKSRPDSKMFWINWDMDHSFIDMSSQAELTGKKENWRQAGWELVYRPVKSDKWSDYNFSDARPIIFNRLMHEDDEYRNYVINLCRDLLNHRLTEQFFKDRLQYYNVMLDNYGKKNTKYMKHLDKFIKNRPIFIREEMEKLFKLGKSLSCRITGPSDIKYKIDGYHEHSGYHGYYFRGNTIKIEIASHHKNNFSHWLVNGKIINQNPLFFKINSETIVEPVFL